MRRMRVTPPSRRPQKNSRWLRHIEERHLIASQLPPTLTDATGTITQASNMVIV
jgi:hypothetical protein